MSSDGGRLAARVGVEIQDVAARKPSTPITSCFTVHILVPLDARHSVAVEGPLKPACVLWRVPPDRLRYSPRSGCRLRTSHKRPPPYPRYPNPAFWSALGRRITFPETTASKGPSRWSRASRSASPPALPRWRSSGGRSSRGRRTRPRCSRSRRRRPFPTRTWTLSGSSSPWSRTRSLVRYSAHTTTTAIGAFPIGDPDQRALRRLLDAGDVGANLLHRGVELALASPRDEHIRTVGDQCWAVARPIPLLPPVTSATFPSSFFMATDRPACTTPRLKLPAHSSSHLGTTRHAGLRGLVRDYDEQGGVLQRLERVRHGGP